jgi:hypothetical protein
MAHAAPTISQSAEAIVAYSAVVTNVAPNWAHAAAVIAPVPQDKPSARRLVASQSKDQEDQEATQIQVVLHLLERINHFSMRLGSP